MVDLSLSIGALVGILLSGGYVYVEIGRFATPQVPETLFDERREVFAYTAGLFVGIPLAIAFLLFLDSMANGALPGALIFLAALVGGTEVAQWALLRAHYWGNGESGPFYALGYRAGIAGIFALAILAQYLATSGVTWDGVLLLLIESGAVLALEVAGALLSLPPSTTAGRKGGGPVAGAVFEVVGFFILGVGALSGTGSTEAEAVAYAAALIALLGGILVYRRLRPLLEVIPSPSTGAAPPLRDEPAAFGRTDRATTAATPEDDGSERLE
ncbi:MAG: hypothetical protein L3J68_02560 [Thermoplasmata archaeon]|jgi:hypothetical protein|nr:hypothetical protein [Thermoplasmata archaeon]